MSDSLATSLYALVPAHYRKLDAERNPAYPLRAFSELIDEQVQLLERNIDALYENWFVETCEDWVLPYLGDLVGQNLATKLPTLGTAVTSAQTFGYSLRRDTANAIRRRRRKGTLAVLEELARDLAGWQGRAVEFRQWLRRTLDVRRTSDAARDASIDVRQEEVLRRLSGPFETTGHLLDMGPPSFPPLRGVYRPDQVGLFVWPLQTWKIVRGAACRSTSVTCCVKQKKVRYHTFHGLGCDTRLFSAVVPESSETHIAEQANVPLPLTATLLQADLKRHYGRDRSFFLEIAFPDPQVLRAIPVGEIIIVQPREFDAIRKADGKRWVAVDPERGRIKLLERPAATDNYALKAELRASYHHAAVRGFGGGAYIRPLSQHPQAEVYRIVSELDVDARDRDYVFNQGHSVPVFTGIEEAWEAALTLVPEPGVSPREIILEIASNAAFSLPRGGFDVPPNTVLQIRAAQERRPIVFVPRKFIVGGAPDSRVLFDGLQFRLASLKPNAVNHGNDFAPLTVQLPLLEASFRHCTLLGGLNQPSPKPGEQCESSASLRFQWIDSAKAAAGDAQAPPPVPRVILEDSVVGRCVVALSAQRHEPLSVNVRNCVFDSRGGSSPLWSNEEKLHPDDAAISPLPQRIRMAAHARLAIERSTIFGTIYVRELPHAEGTIFHVPIQVVRRQLGCVRFCYLAAGSLTPARYHCLPTAPDDFVDLQFRNTAYGSPFYAALSGESSPRVVRGAEDEGELGVYHDAYLPIRRESLRRRLPEFTPVGYEILLIDATQDSAYDIP